MSSREADTEEIVDAFREVPWFNAGTARQVAGRPWAVRFPFAEGVQRGAWNREKE
jgi:hypothetical protein